MDEILYCDTINEIQMGIIKNLLYFFRFLLSFEVRKEQLNSLTITISVLSYFYNVRNWISIMKHYLTLSINKQF